MSTLNSSVVSCGAFRMRLFPLLVLALAQRALSQPSHSEQYELDAQKALADTLHDAMAPQIKRKQSSFSWAKTESERR